MAFSNDFISHELEPGELFCDRYRIKRRIADGGMASIYLAVDESTRVEVAIKVLFSYYSDNAVIRARFLDEGRIQAMLRHPNIVHVYRVVSSPLLCFVMEFVDGVTLEDYLKKVGSLSEQEVLEVMLPVMSAIGLAHSKGIIHRDLKPSNILVLSTPQGLVPKVMDFGVAKVTTGRDLTAAGTTVGTLHYMSPEQIVGSRSIDGRADIYSLGVTLFKLVTGEVPFNASTEFALMMAQVEAAPVAPSSIRADVSRRMEAVILRALEKEPAKRFQSISEFTSALMTLGEDPNVMDTDTMSIPRELLEYAMMADEVATDRTAEYTMEHLSAVGILRGNTGDTIEFGEPTQEMASKIRDEIRADAKIRATQKLVSRETNLNETMELDEVDIDETVSISRPDIVMLTSQDRVSEKSGSVAELLKRIDETDDLQATQEMDSPLGDAYDFGPTQEMAQRVREETTIPKTERTGAISVQVTDTDQTLVSKRWKATASRGAVGLDRGADSKEVTGIQKVEKTEVSVPGFSAEGAAHSEIDSGDRIQIRANSRTTLREGMAVPVAGFAKGTAGLGVKIGQERYDENGNLEPITKPERPSAYAHMANANVAKLEESDEVASYLRPQGGHTAQTATEPVGGAAPGIPRWLLVAAIVVLLGVVVLGVVAVFL